MFTYIPKPYTTGYSLFIGFLCLLVSQTTVLGLSLPTDSNNINEGMKTSYGANQSPVVVATSTTLTGTSPLSVTFTGNQSYDPDGDPITYQWDFGDGSFSSEANPVKVFRQTRGRQGFPVNSYTVKLVVTDNKGAIGVSQNFYVSLQNKAPTAQITNPINNSKYALDKATSYALAASVTDELADSPNALTYAWQVTLRHNNHDQIITAAGGGNPVINISPAGCGGEDFYYVIALKVTDLSGLSGQDSVKIYPDCNSPKLAVTGLTATTLTSSSVQLNWTNPSISFDDVLVVGKAGSGFTDIPLDLTYTGNPSFTGNGSALYGGKVLYQGTSTSLVVTNLTAGQPYYFRVYTRKGNGWSGGVEISATPAAVNRPPVVVATTTSLTGTAPLSVTFTGNQSYDPDGDQVYYEWMFSDGTYLYEANPVKVFTQQTGQHGSGIILNYTAQLTVIDSKGLRSTSQVFAISLQGSVSSVEAGKCYRLVSRVSGKVMGVEGNSQNDGAQIRQRADANEFSQRWRFESVGNGFYKIAAVHSNKAMDVMYSSQDNGAGIQQWAYNGEWSYNQHFALQRNSSGYYQITARHSGKALDLPGNINEEGGIIIQNPPTGGTSQQWGIEERSCPNNIETTKCYRIQSRSSGLVLNVPAGSQSDGTALRQNTNTDQPWQKWRFTPADGGYYSISVLHNQKGIQVSNSSTADNALLEQWTYWGGTHQQWAVQRNADGFFTFSNRNSSKAITVQNASTAESAAISQQTLGSGQNQQWSIAETTCPVGARLAAVEEGVAFSLWPNPARDHVLINLSPAVGQPVGLELHDLMGRTLQQTNLEAAPEQPYRFSTDQLPDGVYLIQIRPTGQSPTTLRLLIQR